MWLTTLESAPSPEVFISWFVTIIVVSIVIMFKVLLLPLPLVSLDVVVVL